MDEFNTYQQLNKESGAQQSVPEKGKFKTLRVNLVRMDIEPSSVSSNYNIKIPKSYCLFDRFLTDMKLKSRN